MYVYSFLFRKVKRNSLMIRNRYIGQFLDGFKHGIGKFLVNTIGDVYEGDFQNGLRNGEVRFLYNMK